MDEKKICFISKVINEDLFSKCVSYINKLKVPIDFKIEILPVRSELSMASDYNKAMKSTNSKYKVYIHEDTFILNQNFIYDILEIFNNKEIGMIGVAGAKQLPISGKWWESKTAFGKFYDNRLDQLELLNFREVSNQYEIVQSIDGMIMISQYDLNWRDDLFDGDYFYDASQSLEFIKAGYKLVVPKQIKTWCVHDRSNDEDFEKLKYYQNIFLKNYDLLDIYDENLFEIDKEKATKIMNENFNIYNSYLEGIKAQLKEKKYENVAVLTYKITNYIFSHHTGLFASQELEDILEECAKNIPNININIDLQKSNKRNVLHVLSEGYSTGGHTRLVKNWIKSDPTSTHYLVTTWQAKTLPSSLINEIEKNGGKIFSLESIPKFTEKASVLRQIAYGLADVVVLHCHMMDPTPNIAFGVDGGPPIIFLNHADHCFWLGASIADIVVDVSEIGNKLTKSRRGVKKSFILPIPINYTDSNLDKKKIREKYGIKDNTKVLLTIANEYKFNSINDIDYCEIVKTLINNTEDTVFMVIGPRNLGKWNTLSNITDGRFIPLGTKENIDEYYVMADMYLEPFMMASYTSRLNAILCGLPSIKFKNKLYPKITDLFESLELLACKNISEMIDYINNFENNEENEVQKKSLLMRDFVLNENINNTSEYIEKIYNSVDKHLVSKLNISNEKDDYDLFWALFNSIS